MQAVDSSKILNREKWQNSRTKPYYHRTYLGITIPHPLLQFKDSYPARERVEPEENPKTNIPVFKKKASSGMSWKFVYTGHDIAKVRAISVSQPTFLHTVNCANSSVTVTLCCAETYCNMAIGRSEISQINQICEISALPRSEHQLFLNVEVLKLGSILSSRALPFCQKSNHKNHLRTVLAQGCRHYSVRLASSVL